MRSHMWRGLAAGFIGTGAMSGASLTIRRLVVPPGEVGKTHYEHVAEWAMQRIRPGASIDPALRCRVGEMMHFGFGALGGAVFGEIIRRMGKQPDARAGLALGTTMWAAAFSGYMPALGITGSLWEWTNYERARTLAAHAAYGVTTALVLRALRS